MNQRFAWFYVGLCLIAGLGLTLRLLNYDQIPPFGETKDEFMYPFAGISLLQTGVMTSWSPFAAYQQNQSLNLWGQNFRMVTPWFDKPPLYPLITGIVSIRAGEDTFAKIRLSTIRLVPIVLSLFAIFLVGLVAASISSPQTGLVAAALYATIPTIVLGNRLSLTENLLIPLSLLGLWLFQLYEAKSKNASLLIVLGLTSGLIATTKQIGISFTASIVVLFLMKRQFREALLVGVITVPFALINPLSGFFYNWNIYQNVIAEFNQAHALGLPEMAATLFRTPGIGHKESIFLDGMMLSGFIFFFASPFYLPHILKEKTYQLLLYPFLYLVILSLLEGGTTWYGWHLFPLYPFLSIILAIAAYELYHKPYLLQFLFFFVTWGASSYRFLMLIHKDVLINWQTPLGFLLAVCVILWIIKNGFFRKLLLLLLLSLAIAINIYSVINLPLIYPSKPQPLSSSSHTPGTY